MLLHLGSFITFRPSTRCLCCDSFENQTGEDKSDCFQLDNCIKSHLQKTNIP